ncbi:methyl-accepting chemotaxis protein [Psychrobium sp. 1_MG-2023]|uniref:methyl-accepting chemotaxis protein n=1 Tax=Psychrobium sp. 1_MG-2023 TaxID=3062624 RepID=UPI000C33DD6C|nr:methyl-accepting chemotaxis protein [Psychrobium sp. 1_MG-2023]MDP2561106.1 methyl-accepting chemotaxis protein [Psychrobium sp. 1_MG-2023]PKF58393.1 methyl-accepting chemotaxis protein [Alteromonadales bacterium alter-6D02]
MKLKQQVLIAFLSIGLLPLILLGVTALYTASNSLEYTAYNKLEAVREIKKTQIESYFKSRETELVVLRNTVSKYFSSNQNDSAVQASNHHSQFSSFIEHYGYYDLFLINPSGDVFYTVERESDYQTNLLNGAYSDSGLARLFTNVMNSGSFKIEDFSPYAPSNGVPAGFIGVPLMDKGEIKLVIALQLSLERIDSVMQQREGMGKTGESYLVGHDFKLRSDSFLDPVARSVEASFAGDVANNGVDTTAVRAALKGEKGSELIIDYNGNPVLSAYTPLNIKDVNWVLLTEIDEAEALKSVKDLRFIIVMMGLITAMIVAAIALIFTRAILRPIGGEPKRMANLAELIAEGDLTYRFPAGVPQTGVYSSMYKMTNHLNSVLGKIGGMTVELSTAAGQSSVVAEQANISLQEQQVNIQNVSSAMHEMAATIQEVSVNAHQVAGSTLGIKDSSGKAKAQVDQTIRTISVLSQEISSATSAIDTVEQKSQEIGTILEVIRGIADQTNLLALNAAIEAARAGEQGRGFAVVADEVRQLAHKTQLSTSDIENMISVLQAVVKDVVTVMTKSNQLAEDTVENAKETANSITASYNEIESISANAEQIATAASQQSLASEEINQALVIINDAAKQNALGVTEISASSEHLNQLGYKLKQVAGEFKVN